MKSGQVRADPKPPAKAPKPRRPIAKKRARKRTWKTPRCVWGRCKQPQKVIERCQKHARAHLDLLWSRLIRLDVCVIDHRSEAWVGKPFPCGGPIQANHGFARG